MIYLSDNPVVETLVSNEAQHVRGLIHSYCIAFRSTVSSAAINAAVSEPRLRLGRAAAPSPQG